VKLVGARLKEGVQYTGELHVLKFKDTMQSIKKENWKETFEKEHNHMVENRV
jgi:hypothetical protein